VVDSRKDGIFFFTHLGDSRMAFAVTANYHDRDNKDKRWLVRKVGQEEGIPTSRVVTGPGTFERSEMGGLEEGFGCAIVAKVEKASTGISASGAHIKKGSLTKLVFTGSSFDDELRFKTVRDFRSLILLEDGSIFAVI